MSNDLIMAGVIEQLRKIFFRVAAIIVLAAIVGFLVGRYT